jgi:peptidoglycan/LPS O-acetylase OafA/YrhL
VNTSSLDRRHFPALDGLRGVSILLVLVGHASFSKGCPPWLAPVAPVSNLGVAIFFVLSGYLITTLLMQEEARNAGISLRRFYLRRALRIMPASYAYVGVIALLAGLGLLILKRGDIACALLYLMDYHHDRAWSLGHYWSLSVEEQFYLVWPPALAALGARRALYLALVLLALAELFPSLGIALMPSWNHELRLPNGAAPIAIGCLLALRFDRLGAMRFWRSGWWPAALIAVCVVQVHQLNANRVVHGLQLLTHLLVAVVILRSVRVDGDLWGRILGSRVLRTAGTLSYSLYIWQQLFLGQGGWSWTVFPLNLLCVLAVAVAGHLLVERPFLRLKSRFSSERDRRLDEEAALVPTILS